MNWKYIVVGLLVLFGSLVSADTYYRITSNVTLSNYQIALNSTTGNITVWDGTTQIPYWYDADTDKVWIKLNLTANVATDVAIKSAASNTANGEAVFDLFDDFTGTTLNTSKWTEYQSDSGASYSVSGSNITLSPTASVTNAVALESNATFTNDVVVEARVFPQSAYYFEIGMITNSSLATATYHINYDTDNLGYDFIAQEVNSTSYGYEVNRRDAGNSTLIIPLFAGGHPYSNIRYYCKYDSAGLVDLKISNTTGTVFGESNATDTTYLSDAKHVVIWQGEYSDGNGAPSAWDWVLVRKYSDANISITKLNSSIIISTPKNTTYLVGNEINATVWAANSVDLDVYLNKKFIETINVPAGFSTFNLTLPMNSSHYNLTVYNASNYSINASQYFSGEHFKIINHSFSSNVLKGEDVTLSYLLYVVSGYSVGDYSLLVNNVSTDVLISYIGAIQYSNDIANSTVNKYTYYISTYFTQNSNQVNFSASDNYSGTQYDNSTINASNFSIAPCSTNPSITLEVYNESDNTHLSSGNDYLSVFTLFTGHYNQTFSFDNKSVGDISFCVSPANISIQANATIKYSHDNMTLRKWWLDNATLSNTTQIVKMYLLPNSESQLISFTLNDKAGLAKEGYVIQFLKWYATDNNYVPVAEVRTDKNGEGGTYLKMFDSWYEILIFFNGKSVQQIPPMQILDYSISLTYEEGISNIAEQIGNLAYTCSESGGIISCTVADTTGIAEEWMLEVYKQGYFTNTLMANKTLTASSGSLIYQLPDSSNTYYYSLSTLVGGSKYPLTSQLIQIPIATEFGQSGVIASAFLILSMILAVAGYPTLIFIVLVFTVVVSVILNFLYLTAFGIIGLVVVAGIMLFKGRR